MQYSLLLKKCSTAQEHAREGLVGVTVGPAAHMQSPAEDKAGFLAVLVGGRSCPSKAPWSTWTTSMESMPQPQTSTLVHWQPARIAIWYPPLMLCLSTMACQKRAAARLGLNVIHLPAFVVGQVGLVEGGDAPARARIAQLAMHQCAGEAIHPHELHPCLLAFYDGIDAAVGGKLQAGLGVIIGRRM